MMDSGWSIKSSVLRLWPLLLLYVVIAIALSSERFVGDEAGYIRMASRLAGHSSSTDRITLWWGPGYPVVLIPFASSGLPWLGARLLNAFLLFGAVVYFCNALAFWLQKSCTIVVAYALGLYPPFWREVHLVITESLVFFLICGFIYHFCWLSRGSKKAWFHLLVTSVYLGYLALTKVFFGYVIAAGLVSFGGMYIWQRKEKLRQTAYVYLLALVLCLPYLVYTYSVTGKVFYWGTSGGMSLYWMSTPYENEWGSWFSAKNVQEYPELAHHREFFDRIAGLSEVERDSEFKKQAILNITHYPMKYFVNWMANMGRLLFSYPFSYGQHSLRTYFYLIPNMFIVVLFVLGIFPVILRWRSIPYEMYALLFFDLVAFGGTSLVSAYDRQFRPLVPILILWISFVYTRVLGIEVRPESEILATLHF